MRTYHYDQITGELTGVGEADVSPLDQLGDDDSPVYLLPAFSTAAQPPEHGDYEIPVWDGEAWRLTPDYRGVEMYLPGEAGEPVAAINALGMTPSAVGAVLVAPPEPGEHQVALLVDGQWELRADYRAVPLWHIDTRALAAITEVGVVPADIDATDVEPPTYAAHFSAGEWVPDLAAIRAQIWTAIKVERDRRTQEGGFKVGDYWFHSDTFSRSQQLGLVALADRNAIPQGTEWKTMSGAYVPMTPTLPLQILGAGALSDIANFAAADAHHAALDAAAEPWAYDFSGGWPAGYEG